MLSVQLLEGKYVVAVSGGVDSVVLLDLLAKKQGLDLIVAHFDHGIRDNSSRDKDYVAKLSQKYSLPFEFEQGRLGKGASEEEARKARYEFLQKIRKKNNATAVITAHHQDDVIETICINLIRGTGRLGLSSLKDTENIKRPLVRFCKDDLITYAKENNLSWVEDETNATTDYLRNWLRNKILNKLSKEQREQFIKLYENSGKFNQEMNSLLSSLLGESSRTLQKSIIVNSSHDVAKELIAHWLRDNDIRDFDQKTLERLTLGIKTLSPGKTIAVKKGWKVKVGQKSIYLESESSKNTSHSV